ncbi:MAG TPA: hypothetical protein VNV65_07975 [Candidatus Solibacter sp.]|nr:hypothetical protein [Candidatus Solibacter sp.]
MAALTRGRVETGLIAAAGFALVIGARIATPQAPPMFEGAFIPAPYKYCSPPSNLASSNVQPSSGKADLQVLNGASKLGTAETADPGGAQVVAFFAQGVFKTDQTVHLTITPRCHDAPDPPPHSTLVGNDYLIEAYTGSSPDPANPLPLQTPAQVLLRAPPIPYNTAREYYAGAWHETTFGAQTDIVNLTLDRLGDIALFDDTSLKTPPKAPPSFNYTAIFEAVLTIVAILIVAAGIIAQRRRTRPAGRPTRPGQRAARPDGPKRTRKDLPRRR